MTCCIKKQTCDILDGTMLPSLNFIRTSFSREILSKEQIDSYPDNWNAYILQMPDAYGGPTRTAIVHMMQIMSQSKVLLKCVEHLPKREFEELFGFHCGQFVMDRVVSLDANVVCVVE